MDKKTLPYCTDNGHEYYIHFDPKNKTAGVTCKTENNTAPETQEITEKDVLCIIETAKTFGIERVILYTNYGIGIHSRTLKTANRFKDFKIVKN